jgi:phospholipase D1/2
MANPKDFFLPEVKGGYPDLRKPLNQATEIKRLIDGQKVYQAQEEAILAAKKKILFVTWAFEPKMLVQSDSARKVVDYWGQLLLSAASHASVRILMTDQDPIFRLDDHARAWFAYRALVNSANKLGISQANFQVAVARHPADWRGAVVKIAEQQLDAIVANIAKGSKDKVLSQFQFTPGLWGLIDPVAGKKLKPPVASIPGTHHAKLLIIDEQIAFVGGINHVAANIDNQKHEMPAATNYQWHDGAVKVQGKIVADIVYFAYQMWDLFHPKAKQFVADANKLKVSRVNPLPPCDTTDIGPPGKPPGGGKISAQVWRTVCSAIAKDQPTTTCKDISDGYIQAIGRAEKFIYIENQYLRDKGMADALVKRFQDLKAKKPPVNLNVIILLPGIAEEVILAQAAGQEPDALTKQGVNLQHDIIEQLQNAFGANLGVFSPMAGGRTVLITDPITKKETTLKKVINVHTKLMIIDDVFATLGSANANPRSFQLDTEMNLAWHDPSSASVKGLRNELWREMLGDKSGADSWKEKQYAAKWSGIAADNAKLTGERGWHGFIVPYDNSRSFPKGNIPDWLTRAEPRDEGTQLA